MNKEHHFHSITDYLNNFIDLPVFHVYRTLNQHKQ